MKKHNSKISPLRGLGSQQHNFPLLGPRHILLNIALHFAFGLTLDAGTLWLDLKIDHKNGFFPLGDDEGTNRHYVYCTFNFFFLKRHKKVRAR